MNRTNRTIAVALAGLLLAAPVVVRAETVARTDPEYRSPSTAVRTSLISTLVPIGLGIGIAASQSESNDTALLAVMLVPCGYFFGPATGHVYAGRKGRAWAGIGVRVVAAGAIAAAAGATWDGRNSGAEALGIVGAGVGAFSLIYDIARAGHSAELTNENLGVRARLRPAVISSSPGAEVRVTF